MSYLGSLSREIVGGLEETSDTLLDGGIATVIGRHDGVLETSGVLEVDIELAVLALLGDRDTRTDGRNVRIENESDNGTVIRDLSAHGTLRAASSAISDASDLDLLCVREIAVAFQVQNPVLSLLGEHHQAQQCLLELLQRAVGEQGATSFWKSELKLGSSDVGVKNLKSSVDKTEKLDDHH